MTLGPNILCMSVIDGRPSRLVRIEHRVHSTGAYECQDVETGATSTYFAQNLMPTNQVPSRYSFHMFYGVAHIIAASMNAWPEPVDINPGRMSVETLARRVREARDAKTRYPAYKHPALNDKTFEANAHLLRTKIVVTPSGTVLRVGPKEALADSGKAATTVPLGAPTDNEVLIENPSPENLERLCRLKTDRVFVPQPNFIIVGVTPQQREDLESRYDVAFAPFEGQPDRFQLL